MQSPDLSAKTVGIVENAKNRKLLANLEKQGNKIVAFPEYKTAPLEIKTEIMNEIFGFDWLIFTDLFAADHFLQILEENGADFYDLDALRICAFGEAVADRLRFRQIHSDVIPPKIKNEEIFSGLKNYIFSEDFSGLKILLINEPDKNSDFIEILSAANAELTELSVYRGEFADSSVNIPKLKAIVKGGGLDEFIFTAPEDVFTISRLFINEDLSEVFSEIKITANDEITRQTVEEHF